MRRTPLVNTSAEATQQKTGQSNEQRIEEQLKTADKTRPSKITDNRHDSLFSFMGIST
jgi:hypothetical protein